MNRHRHTTTGVAVLMYHRVCPRSAHTACYFARGTAIAPEIFSAQMHYLAERADVVALGRLDEVRQAHQQTRPKARPTVVLTFDDGYADIRTRVWPLCQELGLPFSVFPIAGHTADSSVPCWVDWYYGLLHGARRRDSVILRGVGLGEPERAPAIDEDLRWWVRGPLKELLHRAEPERRSQLLGELAELLEAGIDTSAWPGNYTWASRTCACCRPPVSRWEGTVCTISGCATVAAASGAPRSLVAPSFWR